MKRTLTGWAAAALFAAATVAAADLSEQEKAAVTAAEQWLALVDEEKYAESWQEAAAFFKRALTQAQWEQSMRAFRQPLGKLRSRSVKSAAFRTALPGAPDGEYVVIQFTSSYEHKEAAVETVTPMLDPDGVWRVSGYYIK
jgi:hypothetical protein